MHRTNNKRRNNTRPLKLASVLRGICLNSSRPAAWLVLGHLSYMGLIGFTSLLSKLRRPLNANQCIAFSSASSDLFSSKYLDWPFLNRVRVDWWFGLVACYAGFSGYCRKKTHLANKLTNTASPQKKREEPIQSGLLLCMNPHAPNADLHSIIVI